MAVVLLEMEIMELKAALRRLVVLFLLMAAAEVIRAEVAPAKL